MTLEDLGDPIATGRTAEIYAWEDGYVLKLFHAWMPTSAAYYEARIARAVYETGNRVPAIGDIVDIDGRIGIPYERVVGVSMMTALGRQPWRLGHFARCLADLHAEMHTRRNPELPSQKERLIAKIEGADPLPKYLKDKALTTLANLPTDDKLCHGDFHPDNVLMTTEGPIVIDWVDATRGHPMADVARTSLLLSTGALPPETPRPIRWLISGMRHLFHKTYLKRYLQLTPFHRQEIEAWQPLIAAARLSENIDAEQTHLIARVETGLSRNSG
jgi:Ser/Thr protein kinase RdoA (MazF antagonist)